MKNGIHKIKRIFALVLAVVLCMSSVINVGAQSSGSWQQDAIGWWYENADGSYPKNTWRTIDGNRYYFNGSGYAVTGWQQIRNKWYLFDNNCIMLTGWQYSGDSWYYMYKNGEMLTGWQITDIGPCYFTSSGKWVQDTHYQDDFALGIDVSKWQGEIDWKAVKNSGIQFAFVRLGHGTHTIDPYFEKNMKAAESVGIPTGVYFYSTATNETQSLLDAQFVIDSLDGYLLSYPVVIDVEDKSQSGLSKEQLGNIVKIFSDEISAAGYTPMLYCNEDWYLNHIDVSLIPDVYKWIARWNGKYNTNIPRDIWQGGETGKIEGIDGYVDIDFALTDFTKIITPRRHKADTYTRQNGVWVTDSVGKWYSYTHGGWAVGWELIGKDWYYFDQSGYMATGWINDGVAWYYLESYGVWTGHKKDELTDESVHNALVPIDEVSPTCTAEGVKQHFKCDVCGKLFIDEKAENEVSKSELVLEKIEHTLSPVDAIGSTCTTDGNIAHSKCEVCKRLFVDGQEISDKEVIIKAEHKLVHIDEIPPQIDVQGVMAHEVCSVCEKIFLNGKEAAEKDLTIPALPRYTEGWKIDGNGWWYQYADGTYAQSGWKHIGAWYYFNDSGYMVIGWINDGGIWYYTDASGAMQTGWQYLGGDWYYFNDGGAMVTGWLSIGGGWYYMSASGAMHTGWLLDGNNWYYLNDSGLMATNWQLIGGKWYLFNTSGVWIG